MENYELINNLISLPAGAKIIIADCLSTAKYEVDANGFIIFRLDKLFLEYDKEANLIIIRSL